MRSGFPPPAFARQQHVRPFDDVGDFGGVEFVELSAFEAVGQADGTEADAHEAADGEALAFEYAAHFSVAAFFDHDVVPFVCAFAALFVDAFDFCQAVFEHHAFFGEAAHLFGGQPAQYAHGVFAFDFEAGVGETLDEFTGGGQDEQAAGVDVQTPDGDPAAAGGLRQAVEDADAALRVRRGRRFRLLVCNTG